MTNRYEFPFPETDLTSSLAIESYTSFFLTGQDLLLLALLFSRIDSLACGYPAVKSNDYPQDGTAKVGSFSFPLPVEQIPVLPTGLPAPFLKISVCAMMTSA